MLGLTCTVSQGLLLFSRSVMFDSFATPWTVAHQVPLSLGFSRQERTLEWVAISFSRGSSWPRDQTCGSCHISCIARQILYHWATGDSVSKGLLVQFSGIFVKCCHKQMSKIKPMKEVIWKAKVTIPKHYFLSIWLYFPTIYGLEVICVSNVVEITIVLPRHLFPTPLAVTVC